MKASKVNIIAEMFCITDFSTIMKVTIRLKCFSLSVSSFAVSHFVNVLLRICRNFLNLFFPKLP